MGTIPRSGRTTFRIASISTLLMPLMLCGCQVLLPPVASKRLIRPQPFLDLTGLLPRQENEALRVNWAVPRDWQAMPFKRGAIYTHQQYRSPSGLSGVGVAYIRLPIPLSASTIAWFARNEYRKKAKDPSDGAMLGHWTDADGREWFDVENSKYHARGYVIARGTEAWIVYSGYRLTYPPDLQEISVSQRSVQTISPKS